MSAPFLLTWLAGTLPPLGILWLVYRLALRGERCFGYNRAFLLLTPALAVTLPLLPRPALPLWLNSSAMAVATNKPGVAAVLLPVVQAEPVAAPAAAGWSAWEWLGAIYLAGVVLGLGRLAWQVGRLWWLARRLPREVRPGYVLAYTGGRLPASSFGRVVFWDETASLPPAEAAAVLTHELAHVQQRHTTDVLWLEAWRALLWPNPFVHLLLPALRLTHELLADAAAASSAAQPATYPTLLARLAAQRLSGPAYSPLLQPFTFSFTLTRIAMLQNQNPVRRWKQWLVLPALSGLFFLGSHVALAQGGPVPSAAQQKANKEELQRKVRAALYEDSLRTGGKFEPGTVQQVNIKYMDKPGEEVVTITRIPAPRPLPPEFSKSGAKVYAFVEQMPELPDGGGQQAILEAIQKNFEYPAETTSEGRVFIKFTVDSDGIVEDASVVKGLDAVVDKAAIIAVQKLPRFTPGKQDGQNVAVSFTVPIKVVKR
ncbi:TonB family protein [Hymenobacter setariae]|uniref:TonB family protein n=1 Tax=Hymenobacter setariae TaxID=2594794 RepID=A0A558BZ82_9BACT|nr:M56 family metallopeptidase [Hymenobacter setariae]TVT41840.1 TonB family protein [Hymenobacter setariae]